MLATALLLLSASPLWAQRNLTLLPDPDPEVERRSFEVADGFEVNLFAADPALAKPIQMNFDAAGRLWLVCSEVYPQIEPGQEADDKVLVLEDRDGDGRAEKTAVFADGLLIPTGVEPGDGGAYVANSTELLHLKDTDGDGKADTRRVVLSGFGTEDTHHILHTLRWGFDGMLYFNQSVYIHSHIETPHGVRHLGGGGIWQFRPETMRLEVVLHGLWNPWGHHVDRWGQSFATDGAGGEGINYVLPGAYYAAAPDAARILPGLNPGSPKYCGAEVLSGRHLPEDWRGSILTNDFRANRVCRFVLADDGAGFAARERPELIRTRHQAFRPIDVKMGPDGAIYIADWYNPIIQHGEVDFRDPRRDHTRGRIWRVTAKGRPLVERPKLVDAPTPALLEALKAPEDWTRHFAKRVLKERGREVVPELTAWVRKLDPTDPDVEHHRLEALWTYQALDAVEPGLLAALLESADPRVRAAATRVVGHWADRLPDRLRWLAERVRDDHPRVRLEAVRALVHVPEARAPEARAAEVALPSLPGGERKELEHAPDVRAAEIALRALDRPTDRFLDYALWLTARELAPTWLPAVQAGRLDFGGDARRLVF
ncbi:MAG TPA: PVC-type heme-binding CxxCH protein, partial [Isosphaeraceae bacterium]